MQQSPDRITNTRDTRPDARGILIAAMHEEGCGKSTNTKEKQIIRLLTLQPGGKVRSDKLSVLDKLSILCVLGRERRLRMYILAIAVAIVIMTLL